MSKINTAQTGNAIDLVNDPLFGYQWHLLNTGQSGAKTGIDLNVTPVWQDYTGKGVKVGVVDGGGIEYTHPDLADNYDPSIDYNSIGGNGTVYPDGNHATSVASVIAAVGNNSIGGVGVAYEATIASYQYYDAVEAFKQALNNKLDILNNSWGFPMPFAMDWSNSNLAVHFADLVKDGTQFANVVEDHVKLGRNGLGTIIVNAAGNDRGDGSGHWANGSNFANSPYTIAVGAVNSLGKYSNYSNQGANLLVSAPANDTADPNALGIVTNDRSDIEGYNWQGTTPDNTGNYTNTFGGTSAAAPMVSGVVALMLEANPDLGYRDVQEILAYTARRDVLENPDLLNDQQWAYNGANNWNGGGLHYNIDYGFGLVDATAAVRLAETWDKQSTAANEKVSTKTLNLPTPVAVDGSGVISQEIVINEAIDIEHVEINLNLEHENTGDLVVSLVSPSGTKSILVNGKNGDGEGTVYPGNNFKLSSTNFWGESATGTWRLEIEDLNPEANSGTFSGSTLTLRGDAISDDNTYIYTNEFGSLPFDPARQILNDSIGIDAINAAAVSSDSFVNLTENEASTIAGKTLKIASDTVIEKAFTGDGADTIIGNSADNELFGGRSSDMLVGVTGNNKLYGGAGDDSLYGGTPKLSLDHLLQQLNHLTGNISSNDSLYGGFGNDSLYGIAGNDSLYGGAGDDLLFGELNDPAYNEDINVTQSSDRLFGGAGKDTLFGEVGNDTLNGGAGNDELRGGDGADMFTFSGIKGVDTITDFIWQQGDKIVVSASGFGGGLVEGNVDRDRFSLGTAANDVFDRFIYDSSTGGLFFDPDGIGNIAQKQFAQLSAGVQLSANDIQIIA